MRITVDRTVRKMTGEEWAHVIDVNLNGAFYMSSAALEQMIDQGYGRIINISSVIGETGNIGQANYAAAKSGLFGLTMSLALDSANKGIALLGRPCPLRALACAAAGSRDLAEPPCGVPKFGSACKSARCTARTRVLASHSDATQLRDGSPQSSVSPNSPEATGRPSGQIVWGA